MNAQEQIDALDQLIHQLAIEIDTLSGRITQATDERRTILNAAPAILLDAARSRGTTHTPNTIVSFPGRSHATGTRYISPADESVDWPDDAA